MNYFELDVSDDTHYRYDEHELQVLALTYLIDVEDLTAVNTDVYY